MDIERPDRPGRVKDIRVYRPSFVGMAILVCIPFLIFGAASAYGAPGAIGLFLVWLVLFAFACVSFAVHPWRVVAAGVLAFLAWLAVVLLAS